MFSKQLTQASRSLCSQNLSTRSLPSTTKNFIRQLLLQDPLQPSKFNRTFKVPTAPTAVPAGLSLTKGLGLRSFGSAAAAAKPADNAMFCFQCEQTNSGTGCTTVGVCGKNSQTANLQNATEFLTRAVSIYMDAAHEISEKYKIPLTKEQTAHIDEWMMEALFQTMTNVNFDHQVFINQIKLGRAHLLKAKELYSSICGKANQKPLDFSSESIIGVQILQSDIDHPETLPNWARTNASIENRQATHGLDIVGLQELCLFGLKGTVAYASHAHAFGGLSPDTHLLRDIWNVLASTARNPDSNSVNTLLGAALKCGEINLRVMKLLNDGNRSYGTPVPTSVNCTPVPGPCILVSGHDLKDLECILEQSKGKGVNVYTHGEMLPAHGYPLLKKYKHLVGHFGGPWQLQKFEFNAFPGPIILTSNCLVEPLKSYKSRVFTRGPVGFSGVTHLSTQDYSQPIQKALAMKGFEADDEENKLLAKPNLQVGFGHEVILSLADKVLEGVKEGKITRVFYIGGCDGSESERSYFTNLALMTPPSSIILTAGCGKYRINRLTGVHDAVIDVNGTKIPRVLDLGQCNDSYSGIVIASELVKALGLKSVNDLPLSFAISWFEQKAVAILLTLLHLGVKNIHLGPNLPAFVTPNMLDILVKTFNIQQINHNDTRGDLNKMLQNL